MHYHGDECKTLPRFWNWKKKLQVNQTTSPSWIMSWHLYSEQVWGLAGICQGTVGLHLIWSCGHQQMLVAFLSSPSSPRWIFMWLLILVVLREAYSHWLHLKLDWKWTECLDHVFINILFSVELDHILYSGQRFNLSPVEKTQASDLPVRNQLCVLSHNYHISPPGWAQNTCPYHNLVSSLSRASSFLRKISLITPSLLLLLLLLLLLPAISPLAKRMECSAETTEESRLGCWNQQLGYEASVSVQTVKNVPD